jgi:hypothetical protein
MVSNGTSEPACASDVDEFLADPGLYFGWSLAAAHSLDRGHLLGLQAAGLARRFEQQLDAIPMLAKLAGRQGVSSLTEFDDAVPVLFEHTMYKSYPMALLERQQFGRLTQWLDKLTATDLSGVDATGCASITEWSKAVYEQAQLDLGYTSGTSGTMSFLPWDERELERRASLHRMAKLQQLGVEPTAMQLSEPYHYIASPMPHQRDYLAEAFAVRDPAHIHLRGTRATDADLLWLAARIRLAKARGDGSRIDVPAALLARQEELAAVERKKPEQDRAWLKEISALQGERIMWMVFPYDLYTIAQERLEGGERWTFDPDSVVTLVGGTKGNSLPPNWLDTVREFLDPRIGQGYGMNELSTMSFRCDQGRYHVQPWVIPYVLDPETSKPLPRLGRQTGRFAFVDLMPTSHWGGLMTGDEVEVDFEELCSCGATTQHIGSEIARLSEKRGGDDKITCAATPEAFAEAMQFLTDY